MQAGDIVVCRNTTYDMWGTGIYVERMNCNGTIYHEVRRIGDIDNTICFDGCCIPLDEESWKLIGKK